MLAMTHYVQPVQSPRGDLEYHLEHWVALDRGQHTVKTPAAFASWLRASRIERLVVLTASGPCGCGLRPGQARTGFGRTPWPTAARYQGSGGRAARVAVSIGRLLREAPFPERLVPVF